MIKAVLLDLDNTLYSYPECNEYANDVALAAIAEKYMIDKNQVVKMFESARALVKERHHKTAFSHSRRLYFKEIISAIKGGQDESAALKFEELFWESFFSRMKLSKEANEFLHECKAKHLKIALVTDLTTAIQLRKVEFLGIKHFFDAIVTSEDAGVEKPDPAIFSKALHLLKIQPKEALMVGDDFHKDIEGARKVGMMAVHITKAGDWLEALSVLGA